MLVFQLWLTSVRDLLLPCFLFSLHARSFHTRFLCHPDSPAALLPLFTHNAYISPTIVAVIVFVITMVVVVVVINNKFHVASFNVRTLSALDGNEPS